MQEVQVAFLSATGLAATDLAGAIVFLTAVLGGLLTMAWVLRSGGEAVRGGAFHAPRTVLLCIAALLLLTVVLGVFYEFN